MRAFLKSCLILANILTIPVLLYVAYIFSVPWLSGTEYVLMILAPLFLIGLVTLLVDGVLLIKHALKNKSDSKHKRILYFVLGIMLLSPIVIQAFFFVQYLLIRLNADRIITNQEAYSLVTDCKVELINRGHGYSYGLATPPKTVIAQLLLKDGELSDAEKGTFSTYRSFNPDYFDELFAISQSSEVTNRCGKIAYSDSESSKRPAMYTWVTSDEVRSRLDMCDLEQMYLDGQPTSDDLQKATGSSTGILLLQLPQSDRIFTRLYFVGADSSVRSSLVDYAKTKQAGCNNTPQIE